ncbi:hypothetical protein [Shewanella algae]|uniref:hypothetical protein n=1 Tax=Shewanella algae TaxID=38313 RepID=UPI001AAC4BAD|nr:hypothetical protein [Shewanella algae]QTE81014.1 hypothetical protein JKK46_15165 [Shewanella algae]
MNIFIFLICFCPMINSHAKEYASIIGATTNNSADTEQKLNISGETILKKLIELEAENNEIKTKNQQLQSQLQFTENSLRKLDEIEKKNTTLKNEVDRLKDKQRTPSWVEWIGILLASVAALMTIFGVFIAIFSFFGYKKIMEESRNVAELKVEKTIPTLLPNHTKKYLVELVEDGSFNDVIENAVAKVTFRGIGIDSEDEV